MTRLERWQGIAGMQLLKHVMCQASKGIHYTDAVRNPMSQESWELTLPLVEYKNAWIQDMLDYEQEHGRVPSEEGKRQWAECMKRADEAVDNVRRRHAAGKAA